MKKRLLCLLVAGVSGVFVFSSCQRSPNFKRDQDYFKGDSSGYYNRPAPRSASQKVESMGQPKKRVVVFNFWNDTPIKGGDAGAFAADELRRLLFATQRLILPTDIRTELSTEDFIQGDKVRVAQLIREGRRMGVSILVIGRLTKAVFRQRGDDVGLLRQKQSLAAVDVEIKLFDVMGGREILAAGRSAEASSNSLVLTESANLESPEYRAELIKMATRNAVNALVPEVLKGIEKMTWEGRIAKISGSKVYVNAGKTSGLIVGDILKVLSPGDDIYDPASGAYLGRAPGQLKGTLEVVDFIGTDGATTEVHTGGNFQEGDAVQLY